MIRKAITVTAAVGTVAALLPLSGAAVATSKKTHKVNLKASGGVTSGGGLVVKGIKVTGKPFGKCSVDIVIGPPDVSQKWKCKGGGFQGHYVTVITGDSYTGKPKLSKGTGKFKGISGTLKIKGSLSKGTAQMTGKARY